MRQRLAHVSGSRRRREHTTGLLRARVGSDCVRVDEIRSARGVGCRQRRRLELEQPERVARVRVQKRGRHVERLLRPDRRPVAPDVHAVHECHALLPVRWLQPQERVSRALHYKLTYTQSTEDQLNHWQESNSTLQNSLYSRVTLLNCIQQY